MIEDSRLKQAQHADRWHIEAMMQASSTPAVDKYFADYLADCRARGKAARLRASQLMRGEP